MAIPTYDKFIEPILRYLASHPDGASARDVHLAAAEKLEISEAERQEMLPSGAQPVYKNRAGWAHDRLKRAGLSSSLRRGYWQLTPEGIAFVQMHPSALLDEDIQRLAMDYMDVRLRPLGDEEEAGTHNVVSTAPTASTLTSPEERLDNAIQEIRRSVTSELLDQLEPVSKFGVT